MFEQATLTYGPPGKRVWTAFLGLTSQTALVSLCVLAPMIWPQALPTTNFLDNFIPLVPPGPRPVEEAVKRPAAKLKSWSQAPLGKYEPASIPDHIAQLNEAPEVEGVVGAPVGDFSTPNIVGALMSEFAAGMRPVVAPPVVPKPVVPAAPAAPAPAIPRFVVGGNVHLGEPLFKAAPVYPATAKQAHIAGTVNLECVVGIDGRIREMTVKSGNPLLVRAAQEAAWRWVYAPSKLNGVPIEVVTILTFRFVLNQ